MKAGITVKLPVALVKIKKVPAAAKSDYLLNLRIV